MQNLPDIFLKEMKSLLKDDFEIFLETYNEPKHAGLRANLLKLSVEELQYILDYNIPNLELAPVPWSPSGFYFNSEERPAKNPYYNAGLYYIQEPSAMSAVELLNIEENMKVLDLCSAPGGKTTQIASKLNNTGLVVSNDISNQRIKAVLKNIEMQGISNALITNDSPEKLSKVFFEYFDRVLIDVPCSGEGMFRKDSDLIKTYISSREANPQMQKNIIKEAAKMLKPKGLLMYSTCTFNLEENEHQILEFLNENPLFKPVKLIPKYGFSEGFELTESNRLFPHKLKGEGHFLCLLQKTTSSDLCDNTIKKHSLPYTSKNKLPKEYLEFEKNELNISIDGNFVVENGRIYKELDLEVNLKGIKVVRNGLYIGEVKGKSFIPSSAFIMALKKEDFKHTISLNVNDENLIKYLKCETIFLEEKNGFYIICVDKYPLGYGKVQNGTLKNYYNKNWRIL
ncbi:MAG: RsmF rRNA methyltransferase first C-terminal domain-containing protein [Proteocatella sp.]